MLMLIRNVSKLISGLVQGQGQRIHQEPRRLRGPPPVLPKRPQRDLPSSASGRLQAGHKEQRETCYLFVSFLKGYGWTSLF